MSEEEERVEPDLTIGELFPADDQVAQWMFSLSAVVDDLIVLRRELNRANEPEGDFRLMMLFQRLMAVRLYEAGRLIYSIETTPGVAIFLGGRSLTERSYLEGVYMPKGNSSIDKLYAVARHNSVHYMWPGSGELTEALRGAAHLPARLKVRHSPTDPDADIQWVQVVSAMGIFGEFGESGWQSRVRERGALAGKVVASWIMLHAILIVLYAHQREIDLRRFVEVDGSASHGSLSSGDEG